MPSLNQAEFIGRTLGSIAAQTEKPLEVLIYDAGSTDGSLDLLQRFVRDSSYAILEVGKDKSQSNAINQGFARSHGDILCWLNSDDMYADPDVLKTVRMRFETEPDLDILYGRSLFVDPSGAVIKEVFIDEDPERMQRRLVHSVAIPQPALFMRRRVFEAVGLLNEHLHYCMDYEYWIRASRLGFRFGFLDRVLCYATLHSGSKTIGNRLASLRETVWMVHAQFGFVPVQWLNLLVGVELDGTDGILTGSSGASAEHKARLEQHFRIHNTSWQAIRAIEAFAWPDEIDSTRAMLANAIADGARFVTLALRPGNYEAGLALLQRLAASATCGFLVHAFGLSPNQCSELSAIARVWVFSREAGAPGNGLGDEQDPGCDRSFALTESGRHVPVGTPVLWLDGRHDCADGLERVFAAIERDDIHVVAFAPARGERPVLAGCPDARAFALNASNAELLAPQRDVTVFGFKAGGRFQELVDDCHATHGSDQWVSALAIRREPLWADANSSPEQVSADLTFTALRGISGYSGLSKTDPVLSVLLHRHRVPVAHAGTVDDQPDSVIAAKTAAQQSSVTTTEITRAFSAARRCFERLSRGARVALAATSAAAILIALFAHQITGQPLAGFAMAIFVPLAGASAFVSWRLSQYVRHLLAENADIGRRLDAFELDARRDRFRAERGLADAAGRDTRQRRQIEAIVQQSNTREAAMRADLQLSTFWAERLEQGIAATARRLDELRNDQAVTSQIAVQALGRVQVLASEIEELRQTVSRENESALLRVTTVEARMPLLEDLNQVIAGIALQVGEIEERYRSLSSSTGKLWRLFEQDASYRAETDQLAMQALGRTQALAAELERMQSEIDQLGDATTELEGTSTRLQLALAEKATDLDERFASAARDADSLANRITAQINLVQENGLWDRTSLSAAWERIQAIAERVGTMEDSADTAKGVHQQVDNLARRLGELSKAGAEQLRQVTGMAARAADDGAITREMLDAAETRLAGLVEDSIGHAGRLREDLAGLLERLALLEKNSLPKFRTQFKSPTNTAANSPRTASSVAAAKAVAPVPDPGAADASGDLDKERP